MVYTKEKILQLQHRWSTPKGKKLVKIIKSSKCYLSPVLFRQKVRSFPYINEEEVTDGIDLRGCPLAGFDFRTPVQQDDDGYSEDIAILSEIHFEGAMLRHCNFQDGKIHNCYFEGADLSHAEFKNATLNTCNFQESDCTGVNFQGGKLINCNFTDSTIRDITTGTTIVDQKTTFGTILKSEKDGNLHFASIEHKQIKEMYKNSSLHHMSDHHHYQEMVSKRRAMPNLSITKWTGYIFGDLLCKYGTSFVHVLIASLLIIFSAASLHYAHNSLLYHNKAVTTLDFWDALYFSFVSFTTLGYGDFHPIGIMRFVAAGEAFIGSALIALFTVIVGRKLIRE